MEWLRSDGCEWTKVCAESGDLLLWDSSAADYNLLSETDQPKFYSTCIPALCPCRMRLRTISSAKGCMKEDGSRYSLTNVHRIDSTVAMRDGQPDPVIREEPIEEPQLYEHAFKLTGIPSIVQWST